MIYLQLKRSYINRSPINVWVLSDRTEPEALLGLWLWSLKCDPAVETSDLHTQFIRPRATEILARRIIAATPLVLTYETLEVALVLDQTTDV